MTRCTDTCCVPERDEMTVIEFPAVVRRSKKRRKCWECGRTVIPGERYVRLVSIMDGEFVTAIYCHGPCNIPEEDPNDLTYSHNEGE